MNTALYWTIWIALGLYVVGEAGKRRFPGGPTLPWTWWAYAAGASLCAIHILIALGVRHEWSHLAAEEATARQTAAVYGLDWGGGLYLNYAFLAVWAVDVWRWRRAAPGRSSMTGPVTWTVRAFSFVVILNAAVIFAGGARPVAGALLVLGLLWAWMAPRTPSRAS